MSGTVLSEENLATGNIPQEPKEAKEITEELEKKCNSDLRDGTAKCITLGLLGVAGLLTTVSKKKSWISNNSSQWFSAIVLTVQVFYSVCLMVNEIQGFLKMKEVGQDVGKVLKDTIEYVEARKTTIEDYMKEIQRLFRELSVPDEEDVKKNKRLVHEFNYNVHMMLIAVDECLRKLQRTEVTLKEMDDELKKLEPLSKEEMVGLFGGMVGPVATLLMINPVVGGVGVAVAGGAMMATLVAKWVKEGKREEIQATVKVFRAAIAKNKEVWDDNVAQLQRHILYLKEAGYPVKDVPKWFTCIQLPQ